MTALYDRIGQTYDVTRRADPHLAQRMSDLLELRADGKYIDVACGTGNYTLALAARGGAWTGVDASESMIEQARQKDARCQWVCAPAEKLPAETGMFDGGLCSLGLHHFKEFDGAFRELRRVIGRGHCVIFTSSPEQMKGYWLNEYFPMAMERSIAQMPDPDMLEQSCSKAGFVRVTREPYFVQPDLHDGFLYIGKHRPEIYLSEKVRAGSSTFRTLADADEVQAGCDRLRTDIESGRFKRVFADYENGLGDYMFLRVSTW